MILLLACIGDAPDSAVPPDDTDEVIDDSEPLREASFQQLGEAQVDQGYVGTEVFTITDEDGAVLCQAAMALRATAAREDCEDCEFAYDLVVSEVEVQVEDNCFDALPSDGDTRGYGFVQEYLGHGDAFMVLVDGAWTAVAFAVYEDGAFSYDWDSGAVQY